MTDTCPLHAWVSHSRAKVGNAWATAKARCSIACEQSKTGWESFGVSTEDQDRWILWKANLGRRCVKYGNAPILCCVALSYRHPTHNTWRNPPSARASSDEQSFHGKGFCHFVMMMVTTWIGSIAEFSYTAALIRKLFNVYKQNIYYFRP